VQKWTENNPLSYSADTYYDMGFQQYMYTDDQSVPAEGAEHEINVQEAVRSPQRQTVIATRPTYQLS